MPNSSVPTLVSFLWKARRFQGAERIERIGLTTRSCQPAAQCTALSRAPLDVDGTEREVENGNMALGFGHRWALHRWWVATRPSSRVYRDLELQEDVK